MIHKAFNDLFQRIANGDPSRSQLLVLIRALHLLYRVYTQTPCTQTRTLLLSTQVQSFSRNLGHKYLSLRQNNEPPLSSKHHVRSRAAKEEFPKECALRVPYLH